MRAIHKLICALFCLVYSGFIYADVIDTKIQELIGTTTYTQNKNFIDTIFANKAKFYLENNTPNIGAIIYELKNNGLLMLKFPQPMELQISFESKSSLIALGYTLNSLLSSMGYSYFMVSQASRVQGKSLLSYSLITEHALDPIILYRELQKRGFFLQDIARKDINQWSYTVQAQNLQIFNAKTLTPNNTLALREVSGQYWLNTPQSGILQITASPKWTPRIICYDKNLEITQAIIEGSQKSSMSLRLDSASAFVMITDAENPDLIKQIEVKLGS